MDFALTEFYDFTIRELSSFNLTTEHNCEVFSVRASKMTHQGDDMAIAVGLLPTCDCFPSALPDARGL